MIHPIATHHILLFLVQFALLLASARLLGEVMKRYDQPPVFGELLAGIVLGPSLLGWAAPGLFSLLFPLDPGQYHLLELISWLGMIFLLLFTGLETEVAVLKNLGRPAILASLLGIVVPFASGYMLGTTIPDRLVAHPDQRLVFHLFMGTAMAVSAVPVIAKILMDLHLLRRNVGAIILGAAIVDDIIGWTILSMLISMTTKGTLDFTAVMTAVLSTALFAALALLVGVGAVRRLMRWVDDRVLIEEAHITAVLVITLVCAAVTEAIGIHAVFGAFIAGVILAQSPRVRANALEKLAGVVHGMFTPVFFAFVGLRVDLTRLSDLGLVGAVIAVACAGKLIGCTLGGALGRLHRWEALSIGIGMNARGGVGLIIALVGLAAGILNPEIYSSLVIMAMVTTLMAPPLLKWSLGHVTLSSEEQERLHLAAQRSIFDKRTLRILIPTAGGPNAFTALHIAAPLATHADATITALFVGAAQRHPAGFFSRLWQGRAPRGDEPLPRLQRLAQEYGVEIESKAIEAAREGLPEVILKEAQRGYDLILLGASGYYHPLGGEYLEGLLQDSPAHVAVIKARGEKTRYDHILVPAAGDFYSQLAVEFAAMYAEDVGAQVTLLHVLPSPEQPRRLFRKRYTPLDQDTLKMMADTMLWELRPSRARADLRLAAKVVEGERVEEEILREVQRGAYDLVVLGTGNRAGRSDFLLDRRSERLVSQAPCTVIVVMPRSPHAAGSPH
jgi:Kef-type K+ transport system membrane component KefB/nucleotide-binding universal stress UspA family protein